jgi:hypothetical protein
MRLCYRGGQGSALLGEPLGGDACSTSQARIKLKRQGRRGGGAQPPQQRTAPVSTWTKSSCG